MSKLPCLADVKAAHTRIEPYVHRTPVLTSSLLDELTGATLYFKCENFQKVGAFKYRGATNAVLQLPSEVKAVCTHSSGNHAAALALAARKQGLRAYIVMPQNAPKAKIEAVKSYGAHITFCMPTLEAREETLQVIQEETGALFIHPYNHFDTIAGQGTTAKELLETVSDLDAVFAPVGGGGLLSGTAIAVGGLSPKTKTVGVEPYQADDAYQSFCTGKWQPSINPQTICDGLLTSLGDLTFACIEKHVSQIVRVQEETIKQAMRLIWERMKIIVEPSSAVVLAAVLENKEQYKGRKIGLILSGGNVSLDNLPFLK